jgi:hypothetical protein
MDIQNAIVLFIVALSAGLLLRGGFRRIRQMQRGTCVHDCGCANSSPLMKHVRELNLKAGEKLL